MLVRDTIIVPVDYIIMHLYYINEKYLTDKNHKDRALQSCQSFDVWSFWDHQDMARTCSYWKGLCKDVKNMVYTVLIIRI